MVLVWISNSSLFSLFFPDTMSEQLFPAVAKNPANRCNRLRPLFNLLPTCGVFWFDAIHYTPHAHIPPTQHQIPEWTPPLPHERSLAHFSILGRSKTSEAVRAFPVERSQQPHDLINGDKHKPALTSAALHSNKDAAQVQPNKPLLRGPERLSVCVCVIFVVSPLWCFDLFFLTWFFSDRAQRPN